MPKYTPAEFAKFIGKNNATVSMAVKRDHLIKKDGKIDTDDPTNAQWLTLYMGKNGLQWVNGKLTPINATDAPADKTAKAAPQGKKPPRPAPAEDDDEDSEDIPPERAKLYREYGNASEEELKELNISELRELDLVWSIMKRREDTALARIKKEKQEGLLLPTDAVKFLFVRDVRQRTASYENGLGDLLNDMKQRHRLSDEDAARYKTMIIDIINKANDEASEATAKEIDNIISEYQEVRGRGEKK